nr:Chain L, Photosystem I reaction center subunit XI [Cyanidioschyzon merolae strain 10D]
DYIKPYNNDPFVGHLATPINSSSLTRAYLSQLPIYRRGVSPFLRGLEIGMAHGYFLIGPFVQLGPLRNTDIKYLAGLLSAIGLIVILTLGMLLYGAVSFTNDSQDLESVDGWRQLASGFLLGAVGGAGFAYLLLTL